MTMRLVAWLTFDFVLARKEVKAHRAEFFARTLDFRCKLHSLVR